ncbi:MAG: hypothetical protein ABR902_01305 [Candidatus Korobacteraceae bacterium]|jgi:hypothetical protein
MSRLTLRCRSHRMIEPGAALTTVLFAIVFSAFSIAQGAAANQGPAKVLEETFPFPPTVQWKQGDAEFSLVGLAWGPANSPEMAARGHDVRGTEAPQFFADRPYVLAMHILGKKGKPNEMLNATGVARIKDVAGDTEYPWALTSSGFVHPFGFAGASAAPLGIDTSPEFWHFFPASEEQKEFLFQVIWPQMTSLVSFRVFVKSDKFVVINSSPGADATPLRFTKNFSGTVGAESRVNLQLTADGQQLSGTEQYPRIGKTLWLKGAVDSLGNFELNEYYPKDEVTGIFQGEFTINNRRMSGYFSKPDGSRLQPFDFQETRPTPPTGQNESDSRP